MKKPKPPPMPADGGLPAAFLKTLQTKLPGEAFYQHNYVEGRCVFCGRTPVANIQLREADGCRKRPRVDYQPDPRHVVAALREANDKGPLQVDARPDAEGKNIIVQFSREIGWFRLDREAAVAFAKEILMAAMQLKNDD